MRKQSIKVTATRLLYLEQLPESGPLCAPAVSVDELQDDDSVGVNVPV